MQAARAAASGAGIQLKPLSKWIRGMLTCDTCPSHGFAYTLLSVIGRCTVLLPQHHEPCREAPAASVPSCARDAALSVSKQSGACVPVPEALRNVRYFMVKCRFASLIADSGRLPLTSKQRKCQRSKIQDRERLDIDCPMVGLQEGAPPGGLGHLGHVRRRRCCRQTCARCAASKSSKSLRPWDLRLQHFCCAAS